MISPQENSPDQDGSNKKLTIDEIFKLKQKLEENNKTGMTVLLVSPFLSYLVAEVSL